MEKKSVQIILKLALAVVVLGLTYWVYTLISTPIKFENEQKTREAAVIERIKEDRKSTRLNSSHEH